jgi:hypothetical protein
MVGEHGCRAGLALNPGTRDLGTSDIAWYLAAMTDRQAWDLAFDSEIRDAIARMSRHRLSVAKLLDTRAAA